MPEVCDFIKKEALVQVSSCEFCEIVNNTYFEKHLRTAASVQTFPWEFSKTFRAATEAYLEPSRTSTMELFRLCPKYAFELFVVIEVLQCFCSETFQKRKPLPKGSFLITMEDGSIANVFQ